MTSQHSAAPAAPSREVGALLDGGRANAFQFLAIAAVALAFALEGLSAQVFGLALPALSKAWHAPRGAFAEATAVGLVGFAVGAAIAGYCGDRFGRRITLIVSVALFGAASALTACVHTFAELDWVRLAAGLGLGGSIPVAAALMSEFALARWRNVAMSLGFMFLPIGGFISGMLASWLLPTRGWGSLFLACGFIALACDSLLIVILPESPRYLALRPGRRAELLKLLARLGREPPAGDFSTAEQPRRADLTVLFAPDIRVHTFGLLGAYFFLLLGMYAVFNWAPSVFVSHGFSLAKAAGTLSAFALGGVFAGPLCGWAAHKLGARTAGLLFACGAVLSAAYLAWVVAVGMHNFLPIVAGVLVLGNMVSSVQTALYALAAEVYPAQIRSTGVGAAVAAGRIGAVVSACLGVIAVSLGGGPAYFGLIGVALLLCAGAMLWVRRPAGGA